LIANLSLISSGKEMQLNVLPVGSHVAAGRKSLSFEKASERSDGSITPRICFANKSRINAESSFCLSHQNTLKKLKGSNDRLSVGNKADLFWRKQK
jgi:hypothetical protein